MRLFRVFMLAAWVYGILPAQSVGRDPEILVRASNERPTRKAPRLTPEEEARRKVYVLVAGESVREWDASARPLEAGALHRSVRHALNGQGFREAGEDESPGLLILFHYGIGYLKNPYYDVPGVDYVHHGSNGNPTILSRYMPDMNRNVPFRERRMQAADDEKLFIIVTAYDFAAAAAKQRRQLWTTTINVDARRNDLAQLFDKMILAGAPFFGQRVEEEVEARVPRGHVEIGPTETLD